MAFRGVSIKSHHRLLYEKMCGFLIGNSPALTINNQTVRHRRTKHWDPKWKTLRRLKVIKVDLPNFREKFDELSEEEVRSRLKQSGVLPTRPWQEHPFSITSTGQIFEAYVPPEGDGKVSPITVQGAKQSLQFLEKKTKTMLTVRKIRQFEEEFDGPQFCKEATNIYIKVHELMAKKELDNLTDYVTERVYPEVIHNIDNKTLNWKYLKDVELPRIVHARHTNVVTNDNIFAQVTVRFHTQQILAVYDRFGRLMHGSEILAKDVLEYVVFEKHLSNQYGVWRIHDKIIPTWLPPREPLRRTFRKIVEPEVDSTVVPHEEENVEKDTSKELSK
ncbi:hypothetical protein ABEB36_007056 [Hypothenemus hampei]|uniref:Large ribosomal subunit protein mL45 n=1 Tax=Hypothenemus hampei TaxID=57062 RepID=A0ABD1ESP4_HYPHA